MTVHHEAVGPVDAPVLVLSSSLGTSAAMWAPQMGPLADRYRVVAYDMRGHGGSPAPVGPYEIADLAADVLALLDTLDVPRAHFCGLSIGGMIGQWLAANAPERVDRLVLCCSSAYAPPAEMWCARAATVRAALSTEPIADAVVDRWLTPGFARTHPDVRARLRAMLTACDPDGYAECCGAIERMDLRDDLSAVAAPTLVVGAVDDPSLPPVPHSETLARGIPGARHELVSDAAHLAGVEQPDVVTRLILEHLERA